MTDSVGSSRFGVNYRQRQSPPLEKASIQRVKEVATTALNPGEQIGQLVDPRYLNVSDNKLTALPPEIEKLVKLQTLDVQNNLLTDLPPEIKKLVKLQTLYVQNNKLTALPPEIGQLVKLENLNVSHNKLTDLPPEIGQLVKLQLLNVSNNSELDDLPISLGDIPGLTHINTEGTKIPQARVDQILAACSALRNKDSLACIWETETPPTHWLVEP